MLVIVDTPQKPQRYMLFHTIAGSCQFADGHPLTPLMCSRPTACQQEYQQLCPLLCVGDAYPNNVDAIPQGVPCADVLRDMETDQCMAWRSFGSSWSDVGGALAEFDAEEDAVFTASEVMEAQANEIQCVSCICPGHVSWRPSHASQACRCLYNAAVYAENRRASQPWRRAWHTSRQQFPGTNSLKGQGQ